MYNFLVKDSSLSKEKDTMESHSYINITTLVFFYATID